MRNYLAFWLYLNLFVITSQYDTSFTVPIQLQPLQRIIFLFDDLFNTHLENQNNQAAIGIGFELDVIGTNSEKPDTGNWCGVNFHHFEDGTWQKENNIGSIWNEDEMFYFKFNNFSGYHRSDCASTPSTATIDHLRIFYNYNHPKNVKRAMSCVISSKPVISN